MLKYLSNLSLLGLLFSLNGTQNEIAERPINHPIENNHIHTHEQINFHKPIIFSEYGLNRYIKNVFNHSSYATEFLPNDLSHIIQFLQQKTLQQTRYIQWVLYVFGNKLKEAQCINAYAFKEMISEAIPLLKIAIESNHHVVFNQFEQKISSIMYNHMFHHFDTLKRDSYQYFNDLSKEISLCTEELYSFHGNQTTELQSSLMQFLEITINKLVFSPQQASESWNLVKELGMKLVTMHEEQIITNLKNLNSICITLLERYCLYLDLSYSEVPVEFYNQLRHELSTTNVAFLNVAGEPYFESKIQRLQRAIDTTEIKHRAYHAGIIMTDSVKIRNLTEIFHQHPLVA